MAVDLLSSDSPSMGFSPRISFSHDLRHADIVPMERHRADSLLLEQNSDFDFCISTSFEQESSFAEELFSEGKIVPLEVKKQNDHPKPPSSPSSSKNTKKESLKEILEKGFKADEKPSQSSSSSSSSKSFWRFKRSSSCGHGNARSLICSLPLLSRSNSAPSPKKENHKHSHKPPLANASTKSSSLSSSSSSSSSSAYSYPYSSQKAPLKKNKYGSYGNGVRISPVLNVPPPYISRGTVNLFGLSSLFCNGKDKSKKK